MSQTKTEIVIAAVDKATATLSQIGARMEALTKPAGDLSKALGKLYDATGLGGVKKAVGGLKDSILGLGGAMIGIGGLYSGTVGSIVMFGNHAAEAADKIGDLSARYQIHAHTLQVYGGMVEEAGGTTEDAAAAIGKLRKAMNEAIHGGQEQAQAFAGVGISVEQLKKMAPEDVMQRMADAFKGSNKEGEKNAVLLELMGKNGTVFMDVMNQGGDAYRQRLEEMRADGSLLSQEQLKQADDYDKSWRRMQRTLDGVKTALGLKLANALESTVQGIQKWIVANRALIDQKFDAFLKKLPEILEVGKNLLEGLWGVVQSVGGAFKMLNSVLGPTGATLLMVGGLMSPVIMAAGQLGFAIAKVTFLMASAAKMALPWFIAALNNLRLALFSLSGFPLVALTAGFAMLVVNAARNFGELVDVVMESWERIKAVFDLSFFGGIGQALLEAFQWAINGILRTVQDVLGSFAPQWLKDFRVTVATDNAKNYTAAQASQAQRQDIRNTVRLEIDAEGRPRVKEMRAGSDNTTIDVSSGLYMAGA